MKLCVAALGVLLLVGPTRAEDQPKEMKALVEKAIKAHGGAENLAKFQAATMKMKGQVFVMGLELEFKGDWYMQSPDRIKNEMEILVMGQSVTVIVVLNKDKGWISTMGQVMEMTKEMMDEAREEIHAGTITGGLTPLLKPEYKLSSLGESKVGNTEVVGIQVSRKGYRDLSVYFDKKTGLLAKSERPVKEQGQGQEIPSETLYADYKDVEGLRLPSKLTVNRDGKKYMTLEASDMKRFEKLNDDVFTKPQ